MYLATMKGVDIIMEQYAHDDNKKEYDNSDVTGKKFEDLSEEEMQKLQGSGGDMNPEFTSSVSKIIFSKKNYVC